MMRADLLAPPAERDLPRGGLHRRKQHVVSEAHAELAGKTLNGGRVRLLALAAAVALAVVLSTAALGVVQDVASFFGGWRSEPDYPAPVPTASDVVIASGEAGVSWKMVATTSDQGLCLALVYRIASEEIVDGGCGYSDLRGDLPPDVRGDPATKCLISPTEVVPCGSLPLHWIDFPGRSSASAFDRIIVFGPAAAGVASVELILTNGRTVLAELVEQPNDLGAALNFYWAVLPLADGYRTSYEVVEPLEMVVARDSEGRVLERRVAAWNGNPTGDPSGPAPPE
jgi:hypothetical protein